MNSSGNRESSNAVPISPWNLPNAITIARIISVPFFIWALYSTQNNESPMRWYSVLFFVLVMASDGIDGAIARRRGLITNLGKLLDPIADKALLGGALIALSAMNEIAWWVTIVILVRELGITAYRFAVIRKRVIPASSGGKLKTIFQSIMLGFVISPLSAWFPGEAYRVFENALVFVAVALTLYSGLQYLVAAARASR
jgi:CDP-diacylglycerol---glycerol-3-phosphate 3-phosphatidyltransferase